VKLLADRQTDKHCVKHNLIGEGNKQDNTDNVKVRYQ